MDIINNNWKIMPIVSVDSHGGRSLSTTIRHVTTTDDSRTFWREIKTPDTYHYIKHNGQYSQ